jgi:FkbM family methyltransferase|tara:strand:+ start:384 stop:1139 length:756 start_codon:yes stop_codon:yes gene_type:complete
MKHKIFKKIVGIFGYKLIEKNHIKNNRILENNSYLNSKKILNFLFDQKKIGYLIQIGANDGLRFDSLNYYIKKYKTKSILVEPIKDNFEDLKNNYKEYKNIIFENLAISVNDEISYLYKVNPIKLKNYIGDHYIGISSFDKNHLIKHGVKKNDIIKEKVDSISIKDLILKHNINKFELFFVDAEGYDADIVSDFLNSSLIRPVIILEYLHIPNEKFQNLTNLLKEKKYVYFSLKENMFCFPEEDVNFINFN